MSEHGPGYCTCCRLDADSSLRAENEQLRAQAIRANEQIVEEVKAQHVLLKEIESLRARVGELRVDLANEDRRVEELAVEAAQLRAQLAVAQKQVLYLRDAISPESTSVEESVAIVRMMRKQAEHDDERIEKLTTQLIAAQQERDETSAHLHERVTKAERERNAAQKEAADAKAEAERQLTSGERRLLAVLLEEFSERLGNDGCNDITPGQIACMTHDEWQLFGLQFHDMNGTPEEYDPDRPRTGLMNISLVSLLAEKVKP